MAVSCMVEKFTSNPGLDFYISSVLTIIDMLHFCLFLPLMEDQNLTLHPAPGEVTQGITQYLIW